MVQIAITFFFLERQNSYYLIHDLPKEFVNILDSYDGYLTKNIFSVIVI